MILTKVSRPPPLCHQCTAELSSLVKLIPAETAMAHTTLATIHMTERTNVPKLPHLRMILANKAQMRCILVNTRP